MPHPFQSLHHVEAVDVVTLGPGPGEGFFEKQQAERP
jgi:hypothetical protein